MARGGRRRGTPGKGYANRTDLALDPNMGQNTAASGGMTAPAQAAPSPDQQGQFPYSSPDESPNLMDPSQRPGEHVANGIGSLSTQSLMSQEPGQFAPYLPALIASANMPGAAPSFVRFVRNLRNAQ